MHERTVIICSMEMIYYGVRPTRVELKLIILIEMFDPVGVKIKRTAET